MRLLINKIYSFVHFALFRCPACGYYDFNGIECYACGYRVSGDHFPI